MELLVLNTKFEAVCLLDTFISAIWTIRYYESGDFEVVMPMNSKVLDYIKEDYYLVNGDSDRVMIIESIDITTDVEEGKRITITGHSLEQILNRRIIIAKKTVTTEESSSDNTHNKLSFVADDNGVLPNLQNGIETILNENVIKPDIAARKIPNFIFKTSEDPEITKLTFEAQYLGENIYDVIQQLCEENKIGFKITLNDSNQFVFELYKGANRTYDQFENPYVLFSPSNDNLFDSSYYRSNEKYKNVAFVTGEEVEGELRVDYTFGFETGLNRREVYADGSDISWDVDEDTTLTVEQYLAHLKQRAIDTLIDNLDVEAVDGEVEATIMYKYGEDFFIGDTVQIIDEYGHEGKVYISEFIISQDKEGIKMYPTFITLQEGEYGNE